MKKAIIVMAVAAWVVAAAGAQTSLNEQLQRSDVLYEEGLHEASYQLLQDLREEAGTSGEKAAVLWRLSRQSLMLTDAKKRRGASDEELLAEYEKGEEFALQALELEPRNHHAIYWKASNVGRWGQTKGVLDSLFKAGDMREDLEEAVSIAPGHENSYYVLGKLYAEVPGFISFGNIEYSVSYVRKAIEARGEKSIRPGFYLQLAKSLRERNWSVRKRLRRAEKIASDFQDADSPAERNKYYAAQFDFRGSRWYASGGVEDMSDREEARRILHWLIETLEEKDRLQGREQADLEEARELLQSW